MLERWFWNGTPGGLSSHLRDNFVNLLVVIVGAIISKVSMAIAVHSSQITIIFLLRPQPSRRYRAPRAFKTLLIATRRKRLAYCGLRTGCTGTYRSRLLFAKPGPRKWLPYRNRCGNTTEELWHYLWYRVSVDTNVPVSYYYAVRNARLTIVSSTGGSKLPSHQAMKRVKRKNNTHAMHKYI